MPPTAIHEPARETPIAHEADLCIVGGSCTGVFAAVRAARLGLSVALVEQSVLFGGMATAAQVNDWHSTRDVHHEKQIIGGLTLEVVDRLRRRNAVRELPPEKRTQFQFNPAELAAELDALVGEHNIRPFLAARCCAAIREGNTVRAIIVEDRSGRRAIQARYFIDASGDGDLIRHAGFAAYAREVLQPVDMQATVVGLRRIQEAHPDLNIPQMVRELGPQFGYPLDNAIPWIDTVPGAEELLNIYGPRVNGVDASDADQYSRMLLEGRRLQRAILDMVHQVTGERAHIAGWPHALGVRETWHAHCLHQLTGEELLQGTPFPDAIANGVYPIDVHHTGGTMLRYLDGREETVTRASGRSWGRWRPEGTPSPPCYHVPYRSLVPRDAENLLVAGRVLDADREGFGGVRVMVNMNQTGEAAGTAAALALKAGIGVAAVPSDTLRQTLRDGGSIVLE